MKKYEITKDRRGHNRITDRILLQFRPVEKEEFKEIINAYQEGIASPWSTYSHPEFARGIWEHTQKIRKKDEALASVLEILNQKLGIILNLLGAEKDEITNDKPKTVNLSASGFALVASKSILVGRILEMDIGLLPQRFFFRCYGQVTRCAKIKDRESYKMAIKFIWIIEDDQERLIEHIFQRQTLQLRLRRKQKEEKMRHQHGQELSKD